MFEWCQLVISRWPPIQVSVPLLFLIISTLFTVKSISYNSSCFSWYYFYSPLHSQIVCILEAESDQRVCPGPQGDQGPEGGGARLQGRLQGLHHLVHGAEWGREDDHLLRPGGVPRVQGDPRLRTGRRQHPDWTEQEPRLRSRGPRGEHPPGGRGGTYIQDSHWSSSYITALSLVESFRVLKYFLY